MSADEFDPMVERLFARSPQLPDTAAFAAGLDRRLSSGSRLRTVALALAGIIGGAVAVRETLSVDINGIEGAAVREGPVAGRALGQGLNAVGADLQGVAINAMDHLGLADLSYGSIGAMQLFWIAAAGLIAVAAAGVMKLSET